MVVRAINIKYRVEREAVDEAFTVESVENLLPTKLKLDVDNITKDAIAEAIKKTVGFEVESFKYAIGEEHINDIEVYSEWLHKSDCFMINR